MNPPQTAKTLLAVIEIGGYPDFSALYRQAGYTVQILHSMRQTLAAVKKQIPDVVVAEFNRQGAKHDRISNLDSLLAALQLQNKHSHTIVFYPEDFSALVEELRSRFPRIYPFSYPVNTKRLAACLENLPA